MNDLLAVFSLIYYFKNRNLSSIQIHKINV